MKLLFTILITLLSFQNLFSQVDSAFIILDYGDKVDTISKFKISDFETHFYKADLTPWNALKDSGAYNEQNEKNGYWKEYPIDTSAVTYDKNVRQKSTKSELYNPPIVRTEGHYQNGAKDGIWYRYTANIRTKPYFWNLESITEYTDDVKNGKEILFEPFSTDTLMIIIYKNNEPIEVKQ